MAVGVKLDWHPERLTKALGGHMREKLGLAGEYLVSRSKAIAPVDTGNLRNSIDFALGGDEDDLWVMVGSPLPYSIFQELGFQTSRGLFIQNAFLLPALMQSINDGSLRRILG